MKVFKEPEKKAEIEKEYEQEIRKAHDDYQVRFAAAQLKRNNAVRELELVEAGE